LTAACATDRQERAKARHCGKTVEKLVFRPEHDRGPQDHGLRKGQAHGGLACRLAARIGAGRVRIRANRRKLHQPAHAKLCRNARNARSPLGLNRVKAVAANLVQHADTVHHGIRALHHRPHGRVIADVAEHRLHLTHDTIGPHKDRLVRAADGHAHAPARFRHASGNVAPDKPGTAIDRDQLVHLPCPVG